MTKKKSTNIKYGILYIPYSVYLANIDGEDSIEIKNLCFDSKETAQFWLDNITTRGCRLKPGHTFPKEILECIECIEPRTKTDIHNFITHIEENDKFETRISLLNKHFDSAFYYNIPDYIIYASFGLSLWDTNADDLKRKCPDFNSCCSLYDISHFEIVEIKQTLHTYSIDNQDEVSKAMLKIIKQIENNYDSIDRDAINTIKKSITKNVVIDTSKV